MSGHSKWAQIKRQKGAADIRRGQQFTKLANAITMAVREGGGVADPELNFKLRLAIERARAFNMPKENIERAIERALGKEGGGEEVVYEGFGPGGIALVIEAFTDNKQRTTAEIRSLLEKSGGRLAESGATAYQFEQKGLITVLKEGKSAEELLSLAADLGAQDIEEADDSFLIYTLPQDLARIRNVLSEKGFQIKDSEITRRPLVTVHISDKETATKALSLITKLEEADSVQKVYANFEIPEEFLS
jgi:YebC/PmpR family DNA-binding regulatory protein